MKKCTIPGGLTLTRKVGESIVMRIEGQEPITITVTEIPGNRAKLNIDAPDCVKITRSELHYVEDKTCDITK